MLYGVRVRTNFGWTYIATSRIKSELQPIADQARASGRYLDVIVD